MIMYEYLDRQLQVLHENQSPLQQTSNADLHPEACTQPASFAASLPEAVQYSNFLRLTQSLESILKLVECMPYPV